MELNASFFVQIGAFLAAVIVLNTTVFGPLLKTLEERARRITGARAEAERLGASAGGQAEVIEKRMSAARAAGQDEMARLKAEGEKVEADLVTQARAEAGRKLDDAKGALQRATEGARKDLEKQAQELAEAIAQKALGRKA